MGEERVDDGVGGGIGVEFDLDVADNDAEPVVTCDRLSVVVGEGVAVGEWVVWDVGLDAGEERPP